MTEPFLSPSELLQQIKDLEARAEALRNAESDKDRVISRLEAGLNHGLPRHLIDRLQGTTPDELDKDAESLREYAPKPADNDPFPTRIENNGIFDQMSGNAIRGDFTAALESVADSRRAKHREAEAEKARRAATEASAVAYLETRFNSQEGN